MAVIGILTCEILEREIAGLLAGAPGLGRVCVLEDGSSARLIELLEAWRLQNLERLPHVHAFRREPGEPLDVLVRVLALGLHRTRVVLRRALAVAAQELRPHINALLLGYGRCGDALDDPRAVLDVDVPVFLPMDHGQPVDDCVGLCLGDRERYCAAQRAVPGTFFLTSGWLRHWKRMMDPRSGEVDLPGVRRVLAGYERALLVMSPVTADDEMKRGGEEFARQTGLRLETCRGTMTLLEAAWRDARACIQAKMAAGAEEERA